MGKTFTFIMVLCLGMRGFSQNAWICWTPAETILFEDGLTDEENVRLQSVEGIKVGFKGLSGIFAANSGTRPFSETKDSTPEQIARLHDFVYGGSFSWSPGFIPLGIDILAGTLKYSQSISKMRNPFFSVPSPLSAYSAPTGGISPSLPTFTSSKSENSAAVTISPKASFLPGRIQFAWTESGNAFLSVSKKTRLPFCTSGSLSVTGGTFEYSRAFTGTWWNEKIPFREKKRHAFETEASFTSPHFRFTEIFGANQDPFGGFSKWNRLHCALLLQGFVLKTGLVLADRELVTASGSCPGTKCQFSVTPQYTFHAGKSMLSFGSTAMVTVKNRNDYNGKAAASFQSRKFRAYLEGSLSYDKADGYFEYGGNCKATLNLKKAGCTTYFSYKNESETKNTWHISQSISTRKTPGFSTTAAFTLTENKGCMTYCPEWNMSVAGRSGFLKWTMRNSLKLTFRDG